MRLLTNLDLAKNELQNWRHQSLAAPPANPVIGQPYYDTTLNMVVYWNGTIWTSKSSEAAKLSTPRVITVAGDADGNTSFDGSQDVTINVTLDNSGVTPGTYPKVSVDGKGRVTAGSALTAGDIPAIDHSKISDFDTAVRANALNQMATPTADVSMNNKKLTALAEPVSGTDAANKNYVDAARSGLSIKDPVRVATTANITLSGTQTVDGVALAVGNRVLVKNQSTGSLNGIYVVQSGAWTRASDADTSDKVVAGMAVWVNEGTVNGDSRWVLTTNNPITLGTTTLTFTKDFQAADLIAGTGLTKLGNTISIEESGVNTGTYTKVTVDATGRVTAGTSMVAGDVTGALGYTPPKKYAANVGNGSATEINVTHNLNTNDIAVSLRETASPYNFAMTDIQIVDVNTIKLLFAAAPTSGQYRVVVVG